MRANREKRQCSPQNVNAACEELEVAVKERKKNSGTKKAVKQKARLLLQTLCEEMETDD